MGREFRGFQGLSLALPLSYLMSCMWGASLICSLIKGLEMVICIAGHFLDSYQFLASC